MFFHSNIYCFFHKDYLQKTVSFVTCKCTIKIQSDGVKCPCSALSLCYSELILCTAVTGGWVWSSSSTCRYNGALVSRPGLFMQHRVCLRLRIELTPRHCLGKRVQGQSTVYSSLVSVCAALLSLSCAGSSGWYIPDNEWELGWEAYFFSSSVHQITDWSVAHID